jgi:hypothetical protein
MRKFIHDAWNGIMNSSVNPLKNIPDQNVRHMIMQVLAFMWSGVFSLYIVNSIFVFGITTIAHVLLITAIFVTVVTFNTASKNPNLFDFLSKTKKS